MVHDSSKSRGAFPVQGVHDILDQLRDMLSADSLLAPGFVLEPKQKWQTIGNEVIKVKVCTAASAFNVFVKVQRRPNAGQSFKQEYENTYYFRQFFTSIRPWFDSVEALAYQDEGIPMIVLRECRGHSLLELIDGSCRWLAPTSTLGETLECAAATGRWVRHLETLSLDPEDPTHAWERLLEAAHVRMERIKTLGVLSNVEPVIDLCMQAIEGAASEVSACQVYMAHGDLHPENIFVTSGQNCCVTAIDLKLAQPRFVGYDALNFKYQMTHSFDLHRYRPVRILKVLKAFQRGYGSNLTTHAKIAYSMQAYFVLRSLVYLSVISTEGSRIRKWRSQSDSRKLCKWLIQLLS